MAITLNPKTLFNQELSPHLSAQRTFCIYVDRKFPQPT